MTRVTHHSSPVTAYIALGSNLDDPAAHVRRGIDDLADLRGTALQNASALYRSAPVGYRDQPDFINAVAQIATRLDPRSLLRELLEIEQRHGRVRGVPNGPRTLDLDILLYGDLALSEAGLTIPHPRLHERAFVLVPLSEIAPRAMIPGVGVVTECLSAVDIHGVAPLAPVQT